MLGKYMNRLQATAQDSHSQLQICYRTRIETEKDRDYVFREEHEHLSVSGAVGMVLDQVKWYRKAYSRV